LIDTDALGAATAAVNENAIVGKLDLHFWRSLPPGHDSGALPDSDVRCFVDGKRVTGDLSFQGTGPRPRG
jgi:hypothetical protein